MKKLKLNDFNEWKILNKNKRFSLYDYLYHIMNIKNVNTDIYFAFLELFWPTFIVLEKYVFLKENFSEKKIKELKAQKKQVEYWMNLLSIDAYFKEDDFEKKSELLAKSLVEIWKEKLKRDFPSKRFIVKYLRDKEVGDFCLTFYQPKEREKA